MSIPETRQAMQPHAKAKALPLVSLIIPHFNRYALLQRCLRSLREQSFPDFEILVVDDGSTEPVPDALQVWQQHWPRLNWIALPVNQGRAAARNAGIQQAQGELIVFLDCDMEVEPDLIAAHYHFHLAKGPGWIGQGRIIGTQDSQQRPPASLWTDASQARFATGQVSVARSILLQLGGFDLAFSAYGFEDLELGFRLSRAGWRTASVNTISWHYEPLPTSPDWDQDLAKERERGLGAALFYQRHPCLEIRLLAQLTPLHPLLDALPRLGGLISDQQWRNWIQQIQLQHPKLALALYRGLLNRYCAKATRIALRKTAQASNQQ